MYEVLNYHSPVSLGMTLKQITVISNMSNINGLSVSMHKATSGIKIRTKPVSAARDLIYVSCQCYQLHLETSVVSEQRYILTQGYAITYETNR